MGEERARYHRYVSLSPRLEMSSSEETKVERWEVEVEKAARSMRSSAGWEWIWPRRMMRRP